jgi:hypothetical protein
VTRRETNVIAAAAAVALTALLAAVAAIAVAIVISHRDQAKIRTLERRVNALCSRATVSGVKLTADGGVRVTTARGC